VLAAAMATLLLLTPVHGSVAAGKTLPLGPTATPVVAPPAPQAASWLIYDDTNGVMLASSNIDEPRAPASVTKIMTALVAIDRAALTDVVTISELAADTGEAEVGLVAGEEWTMWELLNAIVVRSGNDAAVAIAEHVGGSVEGFSDLMNAKAAELGMTDSAFANPHGLDQEGHLMSAADMLILGQAALADPIISQLVMTESVEFKPSPTGVERRATNTNELLGAYPGVTGVKTGFTNEAGRVLLSSAERDGRRFIGVVMGTEDHFAETRPLLEYAFDTHRPPDLIRAGLVGEQGEGTAPLAVIPDWLSVRLATSPRLTDGMPEVRLPTETERALADRFDDLLPALVGSST